MLNWCMAVISKENNIIFKYYKNKNIILFPAQLVLDQIFHLNATHLDASQLKAIFYFSAVTYSNIPI